MDRERIYTFDIVKGIAILFLIPVHALIYQIGKNDPALFEPLMARIPAEIIYLLIPVMILSLWGPIFTLITGANIAYGFLRVYERDPDQSSAYILRRIVSALLLLLVSRTAVFIFEGGIFEDGSINIFNFKMRYYADTLDSIALTGIIVPAFMLFILNKVKSRKVKASAGGTVNKADAWHIYIGLAVITIIWFVFTPVVHALKQPIEAVANKHHWKLILLVWSKMTAGRFRLFPILGFGYVGTIIGAAIHNKEKFTNIRKYAGLFFTITLTSFILWSILNKNPFGNIASDDIPNMLQVMNLGAMTFATVLMLGRFDYCRPERRQRRIERTLAIRRFSIVSLTIYVMEFSIAHGVYLIFEQFWETAISFVNQIPVLIWNVTQIFVFIGVICLIWIIIVPLWEKVDFAGSLEWFMIKTFALFRHDKKACIGSQKILYGD